MVVNTRTFPKCSGLQNNCITCESSQIDRKSKKVKRACSRESRAFVYVFPALCVMPKFETTHNPAERCEQIGFLGIHRSEENSYLYCVSCLDADHLFGLNNRVN